LFRPGSTKLDKGDVRYEYVSANEILRGGGQEFVLKAVDVRQLGEAETETELRLPRYLR
jgi:hypothetical protein